MCEKCYRRRKIQKLQSELLDELEISPDKMEEIMRVSRELSALTIDDWFRPLINKCTNGG